MVFILLVVKKLVHIFNETFEHSGIDMKILTTLS